MDNPRFNGAKIDYQESQKNPEKMGRKPPENLPKTVASPFESGRVPRMGKIESQAFPKNSPLQLAFLSSSMAPKQRSPVFGEDITL
jgi:hypothetical protein